MPATDVADRLRDAAFALFAEQGYDATTVDHIAERAGVGRTTFFRVFGTKEDVIFPDHAAVLTRIEERFAAASTEHSLVAVTEAARLVLRTFLDEPQRARERYALTRAVPALRNREVASMVRYQRAFREFVRSWIGPADDPRTDLRAELLAVAVVTAHNHVLRQWLRDPAASVADAERAFDDAMAEVQHGVRSADGRAGGGAGGGAGDVAGPVTVVVTGTGDPDAVAAEVRRALTRERDL